MDGLGQGPQGGGLTVLILMFTGARLLVAAVRCTEWATGGKVSARRFGSQRQLVMVEPSPTAGVAVLKLKNPPVNSLSLGFLTELNINLEKLENDKTFRGIIITSDCPRIFSAGLDLKELCGKNPAHYTEYYKALQNLWLRLYLSNLMLISAINGSCIAAGCLISLACDYRILADNPKYVIGMNETRLGLVAPFWFKDSLVNTIGHHASERALQLGLLFPPAEALQVGIVDKVVPEDQVQSTALSVMAQWLAVQDHARHLTKNMMRKSTADLLVKQRDADIQNFVSFLSRDSIQKSLQMYLAKLTQNKG